MKLTTDKVLFTLLVAALSFRAIPTNAAKGEGGLRLSRPVETPDFIQLSWTGGESNATYTVYRSLDGEVWVPVQSGLTGTAGTVFLPGFTLDRDFQYRIIAE